MYKGSEIKGNLFGVKFVPRGENDEHILLQLLIEDDGFWNKFGISFSSFWVDDLINILQIAKNRLKKMPEDNPKIPDNVSSVITRSFGWKFK